MTLNNNTNKYIKSILKNMRPSCFYSVFILNIMISIKLISIISSNNNKLLITFRFNCEQFFTSFSIPRNSIQCKVIYTKTFLSRNQCIFYLYIWFRCLGSLNYFFY